MKDLSTNFFRGRFAAIAVTIFIFTVNAQAANKYVRQGASGSGSGDDWTNAYTSLPSSLTRGNTYYIATGAYGGYTFKDAVSGTTLITIKKAIQTDHGTDTGWSANYGVGVATFSGQISFNSSYYVFDGQVGGGPGSWTAGFGFKITEVGDTSAIVFIGNTTVANVNNGNNLTFRHVELQGKGSVATGGGSLSNDGFAIFGHSNITVSYAYIHGCGRCPFFVDCANALFEYIYVGAFYGSSAVHSEAMSTFSYLLAMGDMTWRYCVFSHIASTGGLMWDNSSNVNCSMYVYGNVFYEIAGDVWDQANGVIGGWTGGNGEQCHNILVYNNSFITINQAVLSGFPKINSGCLARNNLWYSCRGENFSIFAHDFNHFIASGGTYNEPNASSGTGNPFVDYVNWNFALTADTPPGDSTVPVQYRTDMFGNTGLTRGAVQFARGAVQLGTGPQAPTNLRITIQ